MLSSFLCMFEILHNTKLGEKAQRQRHKNQINHCQMPNKCHIFSELGHLIGLKIVK